MARCTKTYGLEVHHRNRNGGNGLDNAEVLCEACHEATPSYGTPGVSPPDFSEETKQAALRRAGNQCECTRTGGCH
jgi:5-methylcytosine-specific restriction endonuclease McrA